MTPTRVLVADSHPIVREGVQSHLAAHGPDWEVCAVAATGLEAIAKAVTLLPDIVIMDYKLPDLNGLEVAAQIRQRAPSVEVLLYCDAGSPFILQRIYRSRVCSCLLKIEALDDLIPALESVGRHHSFRSRAITELCESLAASAASCATLTARELETVRLIAQELSSKEIASHLGLSVRTIETRRTRLFRKAKVRSVVGLLRYAIYHGLVEL